MHGIQVRTRKGGALIYPWAGEFRIGDPSSTIAVATLSRAIDLPGEKVAVWGEVRTENIGIEKIIANVISNPNIRFLIIWGIDVRGHKAGDSIIAIHSNGVDDMNRIVGARGAVPYIENITTDAIKRFQAQIEIIDMVGSDSVEELIKTIEETSQREVEPMTEPFIAMEIEKRTAGKLNFGDSIALHATVLIDTHLEVLDMEVC